MKYATKEESFLAGVIAAASSSTKKIGYIAPASDYESADGQRAFIAGAKYGNPAVKVSGSIIDSAANVQVKSMVTAGVDVIYSRWSQSADVYSTILSLSAKKKIKLIGVQPDQYFLNSISAKKILLASVVEDYGLPVKQLVSAALNSQTILDIVDADRGIYGHLYTSKNGGISLKNYTAPSSAIARYTAAKGAISSGRIKL
jgi:basic membrane lipoprotein Med (substrate-binding protein (PBP1-ABC) superfamily)